MAYSSEKEYIRNSLTVGALVKKVLKLIPSKIKDTIKELKSNFDKMSDEDKQQLINGLTNMAELTKQTSKINDIKKDFTKTKNENKEDINISDKKVPYAVLADKEVGITGEEVTKEVDVDVK